jgi:hypothetical protein
VLQTSSEDSIYKTDFKSFNLIIVRKMTTLKELLASKRSPIVKNLNKDGDQPVGYRLVDGNMLANLFDHVVTLYDPTGKIIEQWLSDTGDELHPTGGTYYELPVHGKLSECGSIPIENICVKHPKHCEECRREYEYNGCDEPGCYNLDCSEHNLCGGCGNNHNTCCCCIQCETDYRHCSCCQNCAEFQINCICTPCIWCDSTRCEDPKQCHYYGLKCRCGRQETCWGCQCERLER